MNQTTLTATSVTALLALACAAGGQELESSEREPIVGGPCAGCENVFVGMPEKLSSVARIAPENEPGEPLIVDGIVRNANGYPVVGVIVYAYQTDDAGIYPPAATRHGRLRGWARADANGRYSFDTIRAAGYPGTRIPQHIHMHVIEPGRCTYYIADIHFTDDERLSDAQRQRLGRGRGGPGLVTPVQAADGLWRVSRDITLGENVPGYKACN